MCDCYVKHTVNGIGLESEEIVYCRKHAVAPELLKACQLLMKAAPMQQGERNGYIMGAISSAIDAARAAIAAAKGESA